MCKKNNMKIKARRHRGLIVATLVLSVAMMLIFAGCGDSESGGAPKASSEAVNSFQAQTIDGEVVTDKIFGESELTMVNIWATYCGPCIKEMPDLGDISKAHKKSEFQIIGVVSDISEPNDPTAKKIINETKADYMHIVPSDQLEESLMSGVSAVPTTFFIDKNGKILGEAYVGSRSKGDWESIIKEVQKTVNEANAKSVNDTALVDEVNNQESAETPLPRCSGCHRFTENIKRIRAQNEAEQALLD